MENHSQGEKSKMLMALLMAVCVWSSGHKGKSCVFVILLLLKYYISVVLLSGSVEEEQKSALFVKCHCI